MKTTRKKSKRSILAVLVLLFSISLVAFFLQNQNKSKTVPRRDLDYGLVWFGENGRFQKAVSGQPNDYFNPSQPTIIFVHGWLPDQVTIPPNFLFNIPAADGSRDSQVDLAANWIEAGWNVGIFYWHPFADEDLVWVAEDKIWTADTEAAMRTRHADGSFHTEGTPTISASELFYQAYLDAMADYSGSEIRLAGHSLGNQMAVRLAVQLVAGIEAGDVPENLLPTRLALLDPFWSPLPKSYLDGQETGTVIRQEIQEELLPRGVLVEWYRSSLLTETTLLSEDAQALQDKVVYAELAPEFCSSLDQTCRHDAAWQLYFLSYGSPAPRECVPDEASSTCIPTGGYGPTAVTTNQQIAEMMHQSVYWFHGVGPEGEDGRSTPQTDDDWYHRLPLNTGE
ncbi:MAG: cell adhesion protein [Anaerolineae bacterium]|nr:cell adhesion protein [Anaerolineae bacterium]